MNLLIAAAGVFLLALAPCQAIACAPDQVKIIDFSPTVNANSDPSSLTVWIAGSVDSFCPSATSAHIGVYGLDKNGAVLGKFLTAQVDNIPPGGKAFQIENVRYGLDVASYELNVESTFPVGGSRPVANGGGSSVEGTPAAGTVNRGLTGSGAAQYMGGMAGDNLTRRY